MLIVDVMGLFFERIELLFMFDVESARGSCVDGGYMIEYNVVYFLYDVVVDVV